MRYDVVLWDFDGTLVDTEPGIMASICCACAQLGKPIPSKAVLRKFIGPSIFFSFREYMGFPEALAEQAAMLFRDSYSGGNIYQSALFPGINDLLRLLMRSGVRNAVTTLKPENAARLLMKHLGIEDCFAAVKGSDPDRLEHLTKAQAVEYVLSQLGVTDKSKVALIGDTVFDEEGARKSGIDFIAAGYGAGFENPPQCVFYANRVKDLEKFLL